MTGVYEPWVMKGRGRATGVIVASDPEEELAE
jgi:hypothetical protein